MLNKFSDLLVQNRLVLRRLSAENYLKTILTIRKTLIQKSLERTWEERQKTGTNTAAMIAGKYTHRLWM